MDMNNTADGKNLLNTLRVLYVEDDSEALSELAHFLKKRVGALSTASNGVLGLELLNKQSFDAIICDLWMPEMDGLTMIKTLREQGMQTPVIITSAFSDIDTILKAVDLGIVKYCVKPIEAEELMSCLERIAIDKLSEEGTPMTGDNKLLDRQERLELEKNLKSGFAHVLKNLTGKGPRKVHVSLSANDLEIWATEVLSPIEVSLLGTENHAGIVPYIRKSIYTSYQKDFEAFVEDIIKRPASLEDVRIEVEESTDWLVFKLS